MEKEIFIDFKEIASRLKKKWYLILSVMLCMAIVIDVAGYYWTRKNNNQKQVEVCEEKLTDAEKREVNEVYNSYLSYKQQYETNLEYIQNSVLMNLNKDNVVNIELDYYIDNHFEVIYPMVDKTNNAQDIIAALSSRLVSQDVLNQINERLSNPLETIYLKELIEITSTQDGQTMVVSITADSEELAKAISAVISSEVPTYAENEKEKFGEFEVINTSENQTSVLNEKIKEFQQKQISDSVTLRQTIANLGNSFTGNELEYYNVLIKSGNTESKVDVKISPVNWKFIVLGIFMGFIFGCAIIILNYMFQNRLRNYSDLSKLYNIYELGNRDINKKEILDKILILTKKKGYREIAILTTCFDTQTELLKKNIQVKMPELDIYICKEKTEIIDSLVQLGKNGTAIIVEKKDETLYNDVKEEIEVCEKCEIPIMGYVIL